MSIIYETSGRAREYFELAANLYSGCEHACLYCYGADVTRKDPKEFFRRAVPRKANNQVIRDIRGPVEPILAQLELDAFRLARIYEIRHILLSFVTDPYQPAEVDFQLTRRAIKILHKNGLVVAILTKGGLRATRDFDILTRADLFGVTLTFQDTAEGQRCSRSWEPGAALPGERIASLKEAHERGIPTWVSLEPVIDPAESLALIEATAPFVDVFKVGMLNYSNKLPWGLKDQVRRIDWKNFARNAVLLLDRLGVNYYIKKDLARHIGHPEGISKGKLPK